MYSLITRNYSGYTGTLFFLLLALPLYSTASSNVCPNATTNYSLGLNAERAPRAPKMGLLKKIALTGTLKNALKKHPEKGKTSNLLAWLTVILFLTGIALFVTVRLPAFGFILFLASIIMAIALFSSNRTHKSKNIGKAILIVSGILLAILLGAAVGGLIALSHTM